MTGQIRVGIGGWTYEPWRESFYPPKHPKAKELEYASAHVTAIEINGTFYSRQKPATWADWARRVPDDFVFAIKASRFVVMRRKLGEGAEGIANFLDQGLVELGPKLGPILWQFAATKQFDAEDIAAFLDLLPDAVGGLPLRHALEPRHESFRDPRFVDLCRQRGAAIVIADDEKHPQIADLTADFVYARLQRQREEEPTGYSAPEIEGWAEKAKAWAAGDAPAGLEYAGAPADGKTASRDAFLFMINGAKVRAPQAAMALIDRV
ncbi:uncharacterized protein YecE (DUF72 family) [Sphingomonas vulcanisoli]|uniref:Uncharacterized protein YecE (DUF72 family) n=1 Tax=Sphingomonas vulcanisoli TaxID=1658060 RepID=A0ABX0TN03_9SPHN|nr:DUF72 domain-containing protein [Sphingomonas vulcanisoli]NIJ06816.1 uncharacterized protein YecE (DUF72 family) [Sphingomonas vulcanisoli]